MRRFGLGWSLASAVGAVVLSTSLVSSVGSASSLDVSAGPVQYWDLSAHVPVSTPDPLAACGSRDDYAGVLNAEAGAPRVAPDPPPGKSLGWILVGTAGDDVLIGNNKNDCLVGLEGDDVLEGHQGKDVLIGGPGADRLDGGQGPDVLHGDEFDSCVVGSEESAPGCPAQPSGTTATLKAPQQLDAPAARESVEQRQSAEAQIGVATTAPESDRTEPAGAAAQPLAEPELVRTTDQATQP
jgi:Ca2+-binding RTX toxin-like protein